MATATLAPGDITVPIRWALRRQKHTRVLLAEVTGVDLAARTVTRDDGERTLAWDCLVLAAGARHSYYGRRARPLAAGAPARVRGGRVRLITGAARKEFQDAPAPATDALLAPRW